MNIVYKCMLAATATAAATLVGMPIGSPVAAAEPCPDVEVIFARGTGEAPGVGGVGQAFVDALRSQVGDRSVGVYAVNYAASGDFDDRNGLAVTVADGVRDEGNRIQTMAANCPDTRLVLGGYSQGAVVTGFTTSDTVPPGVPASLAPAPLPTQVADHVAAVVLLGDPSPQFLQSYGAPPVTIGPLYAAKTTDLCAPGDTICDGTPNATPTVAHALYPVNGMTGQAAAFVVERL
jgi:cutinase